MMMVMTRRRRSIRTYNALGYERHISSSFHQSNSSKHTLIKCKCMNLSMSLPPVALHFSASRFGMKAGFAGSEPPKQLL